MSGIAGDQRSIHDRTIACAVNVAMANIIPLKICAHA